MDHVNQRISFINKSKRDLAEVENFELQILGNGKLLKELPLKPVNILATISGSMLNREVNFITSM